MAVIITPAMAGTEYRRIFELPPALLGRDDLYELERAVQSGMEISRPASFEVSVVTEDTKFTAHSVEELLSRSLPPTADKLSIEAVGWTANEIDKGLRLTLYHNYINCQIHSYDETWFYGKIDQIQRFFSRHRPWYWWLRTTYGAFISGLLSPLSLLSGALVVAAGIRWDAWYFGGLVPASIGFVFALMLGFRRLFPYVRIELSEHKPKVSYQAASLIISILTLLATVVGVIVTVLLTLVA